jgi:hypothetical protein
MFKAIIRVGFSGQTRLATTSLIGNRSQRTALSLCRHRAADANVARRFWSSDVEERWLAELQPSHRPATKLIDVKQTEIKDAPLDDSADTFEIEYDDMDDIVVDQNDSGSVSLRQRLKQVDDSKFSKFVDDFKVIFNRFFSLFLCVISSSLDSFVSLVNEKRDLPISMVQYNYQMLKLV